MKARDGVVALALVLVATLACSSGDAQSDETTLVVFEQEPTPSDENALLSVGGRITYRIPLARAVTMYGGVTADRYAAVPKVVAAVSLGSEPEPTAAAFIIADRKPTQGDLDFVLALGAARAHIDALDSMQIVVGRLPLAAAPRLSQNEHFVSVELDAGPPLVPQP